MRKSHDRGSYSLAMFGYRASDQIDRFTDNHPGLGGTNNYALGGGLEI